MTVPAAEWRRKAVHVGSGLFALLLPFLTWPAAAAAAAGAFLFNLLALPRLGGAALHREGEAGRRHSTGIVLYPLVVLALVLLFRHRLEIAAAGWAFLAFGDGGATLAGLSLGGPRLFWNREKSLVGSLGYVLLGGGAAALLFGWVRRVPATPEELVAILLAAAAGAAVESLPSELDDNVLPPLVGAAALWVLLATVPGWGRLGEPEFLRNAALGAGANLLVAGAAGRLRIVRPSGVAAGFTLGTAVWAFGGAPAYALLWIFFGAGTLATRFGRRRKEAIGKAEAAGGRRGAANVLANVTVPAFFVAAAALAPGTEAAFRLAATAAFATALMDTIGTEVGQAVRSATVLLPDLRPVPPGTDGAVSVAGTLAGLLGALVLAGAAHLMGWISPAGLAVAALAAAAGTVVESLLGRAGAPWRVPNGHVLNFVNTLAGAGTALLLVRIGGLR
ncbi:MAG TPA: DUF92 domain-containing protein [Thermoanaerobaculia bacterium]|nr:DUF92 domain-containing protein [Thermoanaerobaculia bacterium]